MGILDLYMPLFVCENCNCIENTSMCRYWELKEKGEKLVCSACDSKINHWHGNFPQEYFNGYAWKIITTERGEFVQRVKQI